MVSASNKKPPLAASRTALSLTAGTAPVKRSSWGPSAILDAWASDSDKENDAPAPAANAKEDVGKVSTKGKGVSKSGIAGKTSDPPGSRPTVMIAEIDASLLEVEGRLLKLAISAAETSNAVPNRAAVSTGAASKVKPPSAAKPEPASPVAFTPAKTDFVFPPHRPTEPLFLTEEDASDAGFSDASSQPIQRRKAHGTRRVIRDPDSDDDDDDAPNARSVVGTPAMSSSRSIISVADSPAASPAPTRTASKVPPRARATRRDVARYLDIAAACLDSDDGDEGSEDEEARKSKNSKWRRKHYDESLGSLKDFIVDDDYVSEEEGEEDEDSSDGVVEVSPPRISRGKDTRQRPGPTIKKRAPTEEVINLNDTSSDDEDARPLAGPSKSPVPNETGDDDILTYSPAPKRLVQLPDLAILSIHDDASSGSDSDGETSHRGIPDIPPATPSRNLARSRLPAMTPKTPASRKAWAAERVIIAQRIFDELDRKVFERKLGVEGAGAVLEWNNRLLTTAGQAHSKFHKRADGSRREEVKIVLSEKVLTGKEQILSTVAHEMCHVASWIISNERKNPHGRIFKSWGRKVMKARPDIEVTTKHDYEIEYKFEWKCANAACGKIYKRHSKSIDTEKQGCGRCKGKLEPLFETKKETAFQSYLRQNMGLAKTAMAGASHGDVMRALSRQWTEAGPSADHHRHWAALAAAAKS